MKVWRRIKKKCWGAWKTNLSTSISHLRSLLSTAPLLLWIKWSFTQNVQDSSSPSVSISSLSRLTLTYLTYFVCVVKPSEYKLHINVSRSPEGEKKKYFSTGALLAFWMGQLFLVLDIFALSPTSANGSSTPPSHCDNQKCSHTLPNARWKRGTGVGSESLILHPEPARHKRLTAILWRHFAYRFLKMKLSSYLTTFINKTKIRTHPIV